MKLTTIPAIKSVSTVKLFLIAILSKYVSVNFQRSIISTSIWIRYNFTFVQKEKEKFVVI